MNQFEIEIEIEDEERDDELTHGACPVIFGGPKWSKKRKFRLARKKKCNPDLIF